MDSDFVKKLLCLLRKIPGVGVRNCNKALLEIVGWPKSEVVLLSKLLAIVAEDFCFCKVCGSVQNVKCRICSDKSRDNSILMVVSSHVDLDLFESASAFTGIYHVVGGLFSPVNGDFLETINIEGIYSRLLSSTSISEIIFAFEATIDGDATAMFIKQEVSIFCSEHGLKVPVFSRISFGVPLGSKISNVDSLTLKESVYRRKSFEC